MPAADVHALVAAASLLTIETPRLSAERIVLEAPEPFEILPEYEVNTAFRDDGAGFRVTLRTAIDVPVGQIQCHTSAEYELADLRVEDISDDAFEEFVNNVAIMHLLPYTRQSIADITQRVFANALLMPIMQRGALHFDVAEGLKAAREDDTTSVAGAAGDD